MKLRLDMIKNLNKCEKIVFAILFLLIPFGMIITPILIKVYNKVYKKKVDRF